MRLAGQLAIALHVFLTLLSLVLFAAARPPRPARLAALRQGPVLWLGWWAYWATRVLVDRAASLGISPSALTVTGTVLSAVAGIFAASGDWGIAALVLLWGSTCDLLDGELARATGASRPAGAFLDSTLDRVAEVALIFGIGAGFPDRPGMLWAGGALVASLLVSYARARGEGLGVTCPGGGLERPQRVLIFLAALLGAAFLPERMGVRALELACGVVAVGAGATAAARIVSIHRILSRAGAVPAPARKEAPL